MTAFQIAELQTQIADFEAAITRFKDLSGWGDPLVQDFRARLDSLKGELARVQELAKTQ